MAEITINGARLSVKDYYCADKSSKPLPGLDKYLKKEKPALWLYVNVTDCCNASCEFCVSAASAEKKAVVDPKLFKQALQVAAPHVYGISFTGGEPMLYPELLDELIGIADQIVSSEVEIDLATNGTNLHRITSLKNYDRISSVHISRHSVSDLRCSEIMKHQVPSARELKELIRTLDDPGKIVLNCVLQKGGVEKPEDVAEYLDFAIETGIRNSSFITMFNANSYCRSHYIDSNFFPFGTERGCEEWNAAHPDSQFYIVNKQCDYSYCHCFSGSYKNPYGRTRFYFRCPGTKTGPSYCRQLVYTAENVLQAGFGGPTILGTVPAWSRNDVHTPSFGDGPINPALITEIRN